MRKKKPFVTIVIPALNEERNIERMIVDCKKIKKYKLEILVIVDGKTKDNTAKVAENAGARVIKTKQRGGKGALIKVSLTKITGDYVVLIDADHQFQPKEIPKLIKPLLNKWDITLGTRYQKGSLVEMYSVSFIRLFGSYFLSYLTSLFSKKKITDVMAGFKSFRKDVLLKLNPKTKHFGFEAELVIKAAKMGYKIENIPITYTARSTGSSSVQSLKHGILVLLTIVKEGFKTY